ncbi:MAG: ATP synthase subunit I [Pseudomonadales bacterium]
MGFSLARKDVDEKSSRLDGRLIDVSVPAYRIVRAQFVATFLTSALCLMIDWVAAYSAFLGGLTCALPSAFMAWRFIREVADPRTAFANLVRGEVGKLLMTMTMFTGIFLTVEPIALPYFFLALVLGFLCNVLIPLWDQ